MIFNSDNPAIELVYHPKSYLCFATTFTPERTSQEVVACKDENDELYFLDSEEKKYFWVDQLRTSHAQRAVERFASDLSRVGLTESDWLRRLEGK